LSNSNQPQRQTQSAGQLLAAAQAAAATKNAVAMVQALHVSGFLAGLKRRVQAKWSRLPRPDVDDCVAEAVESAFAAVSGGRRVGNLGAWLWKSADNIAFERWEKSFDRTILLGENSPLSAAEELHPDEREEVDAQAEHRRAQAIREARRLLGSVGHGQVRDVVELIIDAVEAGAPDLSSELVADTLGISRDAARSLMSRGLDRLRFAARAEGIELEELPTGLNSESQSEFAEDSDQ
jgi:DNA-directed RNA polymerase specialized sigma24 family protein